MAAVQSAGASSGESASGGPSGERQLSAPAASEPSAKWKVAAVGLVAAASLGALALRRRRLSLLSADADARRQSLADVLSAHGGGVEARRPPRKARPFCFNFSPKKGSMITKTSKP